MARFRQRRGYGVHSPFAYAFLRGVVLERTPYYAYSHLALLHPWWVRWSRSYPMQCRRLLFRLANYAHPRTMAVYGNRPVERDYLQAAVPSARLTDGPADFIFVGHEVLAEWKLPEMPPSGMVVVEGIHHDNASRQAWQRLRSATQTIVTFDLYDYGILFFNPTLTPQHYIVNF